jgi:hypothetical protein
MQPIELKLNSRSAPHPSPLFFIWFGGGLSAGKVTGQARRVACFVPVRLALEHAFCSLVGEPGCATRRCSCSHGRLRASVCCCLLCWSLISDKRRRERIDDLRLSLPRSLEKELPPDVWGLWLRALTRAKRTQLSTLFAPYAMSISIWRATYGERVSPAPFHGARARNKPRRRRPSRFPPLSTLTPSARQPSSWIYGRARGPLERVSSDGQQQTAPLSKRDVAN